MDALTSPDSVIHWFQEPREISMNATNQDHERIARATKHLAQLQARELLADQRRASIERWEERRSPDWTEHRAHRHPVMGRPGYATSGAGFSN